MRIWIVATGEPVPFLPDEANDRFLRAGKLAQYLKGRGHDVVWWTARFNHYQKTQRPVAENVPVTLGPDAPEMVFLGSQGYEKHISIKRFWDHWQLGKAFRKTALTMKKPDLIFCAYPIIDLAYQVTRFGEMNDIPTVLDIRDLWPDIIYERVSLPFDRWLLPYEYMAKKAFQTADGVVGLTSGMLHWGQTRFQRSAEKLGSDHVFSQLKDISAETDLPEEEAVETWRAKGVDLLAEKTRLVWVGSIVPTTDGETLLAALELLPEVVRQSLEIIICGRGSLAPEVEKRAKSMEHLIYAGWVNNTELTSLLNRSHVGLLCYLDRPDFQMSIPNKVVDYCAAGLRILTNLSGEIMTLSSDRDMILHYKSGDPESLAAKMVEISERPDHYRSRSPSARLAFEQHLDARKVLPEMEDYFAQVIKHKQER